MTDEARLREIEARLDRLERLAILAYNQVRDVARYARDGVLGAAEYAAETAEDVREGRTPEALPKLRTLPNTKPLTDSDMFAAGLSVGEVAALKVVLLRDFVDQTRVDVLALLRDLAPADARREATPESEQDAA